VSGSGISWAICKSAHRSRHNHAITPTISFLQAGCPFLPPNQQCQSTEGNFIHIHISHIIHSKSRRNSVWATLALIAVMDLYNSWPIDWFNVSWLSWAQQSTSKHFSWSVAQLEIWLSNSPDLNSVLFVVGGGACNRWHIVTKLQTLINWNARQWTVRLSQVWHAFLPLNVAKSSTFKNSLVFGPPCMWQKVLNESVISVIAMYSYVQGGSKSKLLILSEYVNKTETIGGTWTNMNSYRENEALSDIFTWNILHHN